MPFDVVKEYERLRQEGMNMRSKQSPSFVPNVYALRMLEKLIRDDECEAIMSGYRAYSRMTMHDYLEKRIAKRK
jgi:hypothetical protein